MSLPTACLRSNGHRQIWPSLYFRFLYSVRTGQSLPRNGPLNIFEHDLLNPENFEARRPVVLKRHGSKFVRGEGCVIYRTRFTPVLYIVTEVHVCVWPSVGPSR